MSEATKASPVQPWPGLWRSLREGVAWRWRWVVLPGIKRLVGIRNEQWCRVVSNRDNETFVRGLDCRLLDVVEISPGNERWRFFPFKSHVCTTYPDYDLCSGPFKKEAFDLIIAEQVLEHVQRPDRAARSAWEMLRPGGWFLVTTPFLIRVHAYPDDFSRWTEQGLKGLLVQAGFPEYRLRTGAWGNRACVKASLRRFPSYIPWLHSLKNEPLFPIVVWAYAQKASIDSSKEAQA